MSATIIVSSGDSHVALLRAVIPAGGGAVLDACNQYGYVRDLYPYSTWEWSRFAEDSFVLQELLAAVIIDALGPGDVDGWFENFEAWNYLRLSSLVDAFPDDQMHVSVIDIAHRISDRVLDAEGMPRGVTDFLAVPHVIWDKTLHMDYLLVVHLCRVLALWLTCEQQYQIPVESRYVAQACEDIFKQLI